MTNKKTVEVIIIGGSYAGLSAAMALGRSLREVLIIDSGQPCNRQTPHAHNFLTQDGQTPATIAAKGKTELLAYRHVNFIEATAVKGRKLADSFSITTDNGDEFFAKKLIFATGIKDILPRIDGFSACWGISIVHCPYCHGFELKGKKTAILANGERAFHLSSLVHNLTTDLKIITSGKADFNPDQWDRLRKHDIEVIEDSITNVVHTDGQISNIELDSGRTLALEALYAALPFIQHSAIPVALGCELNENGYINVDGLHKTSVDGVYACGDNTNMMRSLANAVYTGNLTGAIVNRDLTEEEF
ncbi:MAG: NAD(P)/FAD-dependent oxidoreductase [Chitinophagaceae bacterium]|nr:MAG: NAD(P)/FAD-dependent oxidoreductase [Chitinophagaceae bacterium]